MQPALRATALHYITTIVIYLRCTVSVILILKSHHKVCDHLQQKVEALYLFARPSLTCTYFSGFASIYSDLDTHSCNISVLVMLLLLSKVVTHVRTSINSSAVQLDMFCGLIHCSFPEFHPYVPRN